jgi:hypothetical protein
MQQRFEASSAVYFVRFMGKLTRMAKVRDAYKILVWKPEWKGSCDRIRCRWKDNIKSDVKDMRHEEMS